MRIPKPTARRLSLYLRELHDRHHLGRERVNSKELGDALGLTDAQVRKDLACLGQFGQSGVGYRVFELSERIRRIMGLDRQWNLGLVGAGNIGRAILAYRRFKEDGFGFVAAFDQSPQVVGQTIGGFRVQPIDALRSEVRTRKIQIGVIATPADAAQEVAERLVDAGIQGILNFAPRRIAVPPHISVGAVDLTVALEQVAFDISMLSAEGQPVA